MRRWKTVLLGLFIVVVIGFGGFRWRVGANLGAAQQQVRDAGYPVTYAELDEFYARPASGENRAYLLEFAFDAMKEPGWNMRDNLPLIGNAELPHRTQAIPEEQLRAMRAYALLNLQASEAVFESFEYDACRFSVDMNAGPSMELSHLAKLRELARLLSVRSLLFALNDDPAATAKQLIGICDLAESLEKEPILISQLVRIAIYGIGMAATEQAMNRIEFAPDQLIALQERFAEAEANPAFTNGFVGERCMWSAIESIGIDGTLFGGGGLNLQGAWYGLVYRPLGLLDLEGVRYYKMFERVLAATTLPIDEQIPAGEAAGSWIEQSTGPAALVAILLPSVARAVEADVRNRTHLNTAIVAVAAERYRLDNGEYPASANVLVPAYLDAVPIDPADGQTIRYRAFDGGFVAYSLARNGTDENGVELEDQKFWNEGDLTFTVERAK